MPQTYPLMLDLTGRLIVIIGGGAVAMRKAIGVIEAGATRVRAIATEFRVPFPAGVECVLRSYMSDDLKGAGLVFAATDSAAINDTIVRDAHVLGILVGRADSSDQTPGDFATTAKFQSGSIIVTVSTASAALTAVVRDGIAAHFDPAWSEMADAMKILRPIVRAADPAGNRRAELFRALATPKAFQILRTQGIDGLKDWISQQ